MTNIALTTISIGKRVKSQMALKSLRQSDVAKELKLSGASRFFADEIAVLADLFGCSTDYLLGLKPLEVR